MPGSAAAIGDGVPCGRCISCRLNYARVWSIRLMHEKKFHELAVFATFTFNDAHVPWSLDRQLAQRFLKRLRKLLKPRKFRYYMAGEYGEQTGRPHYHAILFGVGKEDKKILEKAWSYESDLMPFARCSFGFVHVGNVEQDSCQYVAKYVTKKVGRDWRQRYIDAGLEPEFSLMSNRPGIGAAHADKYGNEIINRGFVIVKGRKAAIPRYYVSRVYNTDVRKAVWKEAVAKRDEEKAGQQRLDVAQLGVFAVRDKVFSDRVGRDLNVKARISLKRGAL